MATTKKSPAKKSTGGARAGAGHSTKRPSASTGRGSTAKKKK
jgi:hypothetical protein